MTGDNPMEPIRPPHHHTFLVATAALLVVLAGGIFVYFYSGQGNNVDVSVFTPVSQQVTGYEERIEFPESSSSTITAIPERVVNPIAQLPQSNPFAASTNPFEDVYTNPFE